MSDEETVVETLPALDLLSSSPLVAHLAATVAHRMRNSLAAMSATLQLLVQKELLQESAKESFAVVTAEVDALAALASDLVAFAPLRQNSSGCDLCQRISEAIHQLQLAEKGVVVDHALSPLPVPLESAVMDQIVHYLLHYLLATVTPPRQLYIGYGSHTELRPHLFPRHYYTCCLGHRRAEPGEAFGKVDRKLFSTSTVPGAAFGMGLCEAIIRSIQGQLKIVHEEADVIFCLQIPTDTPSTGNG